ncbi:hypothetical protein HYW36_02060 [Candidatus Saccharibacteria bacterium]|nr:hypothetical protein [Candidatus Saccharibacteria bacterium]
MATSAELSRAPEMVTPQDLYNIMVVLVDRFKPEHDTRPTFDGRRTVSTEYLTDSIDAAKVADRTIFRLGVEIHSDPENSSNVKVLPRQLFWPVGIYKKGAPSEYYYLHFEGNNGHASKMTLPTDLDIAARNNLIKELYDMFSNPNLVTVNEAKRQEKEAADARRSWAGRKTAGLLGSARGIGRGLERMLSGL